MQATDKWWGCVVLLVGMAIHITDARAAEVVTLAGTGVKGNSPAGSLGTSSRIGEPYGLVVGPDGALYICEIANHLIRRLDLKSGETTIVAGSGVKGYSGDNGPATTACMNEPYEVRFDSEGNLLTVEMKNAVVRRVDARTKTITTIAGTGESGFSGDGGPATQAQLNQPHAIILDDNDNLFICDIKNGRVRRVDAQTGVVTTFCGGGKEPLQSETASFHDLRIPGPRALDVTGDQAFVLALREGNAIYRIDPKTSSFKLLAGTGKKGYTGRSVPGNEAPLSGPKGIAVAPGGDIYFTDTESHTIRVIRAQNGLVETVVGDGTRGDGPDGDPLKCRLARPHGICVDPQGNVYIGDSENHRVRVLKIN